MLVNSLFTNTLMNSINQRQTEQIVDKVAKNDKLNLSNEQVKTFKNVLSTELKTMYSKQQLLSSYLNTDSTNSSFSNPYLSSLGLFGGLTNSSQQNSLFGGIGLYSPTSLSNLIPTSLSNLIPAYLSGVGGGMLSSFTPASMATNAYAQQIYNNGNVNGVNSFLF
ncbi:hypothetical protein D3C81_1365750 [compost metagenome]